MMHNRIENTHTPPITPLETNHNEGTFDKIASLTKNTPEKTKEQCEADFTTFEIQSAHITNKLTVIESVIGSNPDQASKLTAEVIENIKEIIPLARALLSDCDQHLTEEEKEGIRSLLGQLQGKLKELEGQQPNQPTITVYNTPDSGNILSDLAKIIFTLGDLLFGGRARRNAF